MTTTNDKQILHLKNKLNAMFRRYIKFIKDNDLRKTLEIEMAYVIDNIDRRNTEEAIMLFNRVVLKELKSHKPSK